MIQHYDVDRQITDTLYILIYIYATEIVYASACTRVAEL